MKKTAVAFLTKDRVELSQQSIGPLLSGKHALHWVDGSVMPEGIDYPFQHGIGHAGKPGGVWSNVRGGAGAAIVFALTKMLEAGYAYLGLVENDVLLPADWFDRTVGLFELGAADGLPVGAVSARCYRDRVLFSRPAYSVCHNLGAGMIVFSREAAQIVLNSFRSGFTADNRRIFCQLSNVDIGPFWAFRNNDHPLVADWHFDATLATHGLASLALTPSHVQMIGQDPPLADQGLVIADAPVIERIDDGAFNVYRARLQAIRHGALKFGVETVFQKDDTGYHYLPHQLHMIGGRYFGDWRFKEMRAFGEFTWVAGEEQRTLTSGDEACSTQSIDVQKTFPSFTVPVYGIAMLLLSGGKDGGQFKIEDTESGYTVEPFIPPEGDNHQCLQVPLPAMVSYRAIRVTALTPGVCFYKLTCQNKQPVDPTQKFDHSILPVPV